MYRVEWVVSRFSPSLSAFLLQKTGEAPNLKGSLALLWAFMVLPRPLGTVGPASASEPSVQMSVTSTSLCFSLCSLHCTEQLEWNVCSVSACRESE